jgi:hypothetical protein
MKVFTREYASIDYISELSCLRLTFQGFMTYEELIEISEFEYQLISSHKITGMLINLQLISIYPEGGSAYIKNVWFPTISSMGIRYVGFVVPEDLFSQLSMRDAHDGEEQFNVDIEYFSDEDSAKLWGNQFAASVNPSSEEA